MLYVWLMVASLWAGLASPLGLQPAPDWILEDEEPPTPARRITPKSVFVAPTFSECDPGYRHDPVAGRCVRIVKVNQKAQWDFFLSRLNAMYAQPTKQKVPTGPLHVALSLDPIVSSSTTTRPPPPPPPPTTTTTRPTTTTPPPTTTTESTPPPTTTTVPVSTSTPPQTTVTSTQQTTITTQSSTQPQTSTQPPTTTTDQPTTITLLPSTTISSTFPSTPPTTYFTDSSMDTTFPFSTTDSSIDFTDSSTFPTSTFPSFSTETTESHTEYSTFPDLSVSSNRHRVYHRATVKPKPKCPPNVRQVGEYNAGDTLDCETETIRPQYIRFPAPTTFPPRRKMGYVRFPDRTWQSSYWWPHSSWDQKQVPLPSSYQKIQHFPSWQRGRPTWADSPSI